MPKARKNFVVDTSVLVHDHSAIQAFPNSNLHIPITVLEELDGLKNRHDKVGNSARHINRFLDKIRENGSFAKGISLDNNQKIYIVYDINTSALPEGFELTNDNKIISVALELKKKLKNLTFLSRDISQRVKCDSLGVKSEDYNKEKALVDRTKPYTGVSVLELDKSKVDEFYLSDELKLEEELMPNEFVVVKGGKSSALGYYKDKKIKKLFTAQDREMSIQGIKPRNKEQTFALDMLMNPNIHMVTITGMAGSGKTILTCAAAIEQVMRKKYNKIVISRPVRSMSADIGFLPGSKEEKMASWVQPFFDNFDVIFKGNKEYLKGWMDNGVIEVEALSFIRGRSLPNTIFILDEAQNITYHEAKAVLTRMGENSKIILLGDLEQIDVPNLDASNSGLGSVVELFKDFELSGHITLLKGERSALASHAAKIL